MTEIEKLNIEKIKKDNDRIIMKAFGLDYQKVFAQEDQCEK